MSKKIECRLPDELYEDLKIFAGVSGVTMTDIVIAGINEQIHREFVTPLVEKILPEKPEVIKEVKEVPNVLVEAVAKRVSAGGFFRPMPKEYMVRNAGKKRG